MTRVPLPTSATLKTAENIANIAPQPIRPFASLALDWLRHRFDPVHEDEEPDGERKPGDDEISQAHEEEENRRPIEMSRISVPVLALEEIDSKSSKPKQESKSKNEKKKTEVRAVSRTSNSRQKREIYSTPPTSPTKTTISTPQERERMVVSATPSPGIIATPSSSSGFTLTGSSCILPTKIRISPRSQNRITDQLSEAISSELFRIWPTYEDLRPHGAAKKTVEESGVYEKEMEESERMGKEELMAAWKVRGERESGGRRVVRGRAGWDEGEGWESVVEGVTLRGVEGFRPTLMGVQEVGSWAEKGGMMREVGSVINRRNEGEQHPRARKSSREGSGKYKEVLSGREHRKRSSAGAPMVEDVRGENSEGTTNIRIPGGEQHRVRKASQGASDQRKENLPGRKLGERSSAGNERNLVEDGKGVKENELKRQRSSKRRTRQQPGSSSELTSEATKI